MVRAIRLLVANGEGNMAIPLLRLLADGLTDGPLLLAARLAQEIGAHHLAISIADIAEKRGMPLDLFSFPKDGMPDDVPDGLAAVDQAAVYAITRQESRFQVDAVSSAGARGLMQLMPGTAQEVAAKVGVDYSKSRLTTDAAYNALLGSTYLATQLETYDGSLLLAAAAYNAGPGNANKWIRAFGDPRSDKVDPVIWVELIPFQETRKYVQRVLGNYLVYRARLGDTSLTMRSAAPHPGVACCSAALLLARHAESEPAFPTTTALRRPAGAHGDGRQRRRADGGACRGDAVERAAAGDLRCRLPPQHDRLHAVPAVLPARDGRRTGRWCWSTCAAVGARPAAPAPTNTARRAMQRSFSTCRRAGDRSCHLHRPGLWRPGGDGARRTAPAADRGRRADRCRAGHQLARARAAAQQARAYRWPAQRGRLRGVFRQVLSADYPGIGEAQIEKLAERTHAFDKNGHATPLFDMALVAMLEDFNHDDVLVAQWPLFNALAVAPLMLIRTQLTDQLRRETFDEMTRRRPDAVALTIAGQGSPALLDHNDEIGAIAQFVQQVAGLRRGRS